MHVKWWHFTEASAPLVLYYLCAVCARVMRLCPSVCVYIYMCVCVSSKNTLVCVLPLENLHENTLCSFSTEFIVLRRCFLCWQALLERLIHGFLKLRALLRAFYGIVGVSPNLLSISTSSLSLNLSGAVYGLAVAVMLE